MTRTYPQIANPVARVGITMTWGMLPVLGIFVAIVVSAFALISLIHFTVGDGTNSIWQLPGSGALKYFPLALAIMLTPAFLPIYVAQGVTRRSIIRGGVIFIAIVSAGFGIIMAAGYAVEKLVLDAVGIEFHYDQPHLFTQWWQGHLIVAEYMLLVGVHMMVGWLIGTTYYRLRWFRATLLLPVTVLPALTVELLLGTGWAGASLEEFTAYTRQSLAITIPAALLVIALTWAINYALLRNIPIRHTNG